MGDFTFLNAYERAVSLHLEPLNYLFGMGSGGLNTTYIIFLILSLIILANQEYYKKSIPLFAIISYCTLISIYTLIGNDLASLSSYIFGYGILFAYVYLAPDSLTSSYTKQGQIVYGLIVGSFTFVLFLVYPPLAALGAIFIASTLNVAIDKICLLAKK
jgi:Na+-translocating ferredoxin:NAD+ oxidoreductase RnfD subunit